MGDAEAVNARRLYRMDLCLRALDAAAREGHWQNPDEWWAALAPLTREERAYVRDRIKEEVVRVVKAMEAKAAEAQP